VTLAVLTLAPRLSVGQETPDPTLGRTLYQNFCVSCHGAAGEGSEMGSTLAAPSVARQSPRELATTISSGRVDKGMPAFGRGLRPAEIDAVVAYLRQIQREAAQGGGASAPAAESPAPAGGEPSQGERLFRGKARCAECHSVFDAGGVIGPHLTGLAERLKPGEIYEAIVFPSQRVTPGYALKEITTADGRTIRGRYRRESESTIQLLDATGELWTTYRKAELRSIKSAEGSLMPEGLLKGLADDETRDLLAFLQQLK